jgi:hypothetical protein
VPYDSLSGKFAPIANDQKQDRELASFPIPVFKLLA